MLAALVIVTLLSFLCPLLLKHALRGHVPQIPIGSQRSLVHSCRISGVLWSFLGAFLERIWTNSVVEHAARTSRGSRRLFVHSTRILAVLWTFLGTELERMRFTRSSKTKSVVENARTIVIDIAGSVDDSCHVTSRRF